MAPIPRRAPFVYPEDIGPCGGFNLNTKTGTNDGPIIQAIFDQAVAIGAPCKLSSIYYVQQFNVTGSGAGDIRIPEGLTIICEPGAGIAFDSLMGPCLWKEGNGRFDAYDLSFYYFGKIDMVGAQPPYQKYVVYSDWYDNKIQRPGGSLHPSNPGNCTQLGGFDVPGVAMLLAGGKITLVRPRFIALQDTGVLTGVDSDSRAFIWSCHNIYDSNDGTKAQARIIDPYYDGVLFGHAGCAADVAIINPVRDRMGALPETGIGWSAPAPPPHLVYYTNANPTKPGKLIISNPMDNAINRAEADGGWCSFKSFAGEQTIITGGYTLNDYGPLEGNSQGWNVNGLRAVMNYDKMKNGVNGIDPLRLLDGNNNSLNKGQIINIDYTIAGSPVSLINSTTTFGSDWMEISGRFRLAGGTNVNIISGGKWKDSRADLDISFATTGTLNTVVNLTGASTNNKFKVLIGNVSNFDDWHNRMTENDKPGSFGNRLSVEERETGNVFETFESGITIKRIHKSVAVTLTAGASVSVAGMIPADAQLEAVSSVVTTAIGATNGTTGYEVGVAATPTQFQTVSGTAIGSGGTIANANIASSGGFGFYDAATAILLTAVGGDFDGAGVVKLNIVYRVNLQSGFTF